MAVSESMFKICEEDEVDAFWLAKHLSDVTNDKKVLKDLEQIVHRKLAQGNSTAALYT